MNTWISVKDVMEYHYQIKKLFTVNCILKTVLIRTTDKCTEIYELDPAHFLSAPGIAWQACFKKTGVRLKLLTDVDMLLIVEKGI